MTSFFSSSRTAGLPRFVIIFLRNLLEASWAGKYVFYGVGATILDGLPIAYEVDEVDEVGESACFQVSFARSRDCRFMIPARRFAVHVFRGGWGVGWKALRNQLRCESRRPVNGPDNPIVSLPLEPGVNAGPKPPAAERAVNGPRDFQASTHCYSNFPRLWSAMIYHCFPWGNQICLLWNAQHKKSGDKSPHSKGGRSVNGHQDFHPSTCV